MINGKILALAFAGLVMAADLAHAGSTNITPSASVTSGTRATPPPATTGAPAPKLPKPLIGTPKTFRVTDNKHLLVQDSVGGWFKVELASECKALPGAQTIRIAKSNKPERIGSVVIDKKYCRISGFSQTGAPTASLAPASPATGTASKTP